MKRDYKCECGLKYDYSARFDVYFCSVCDIWRESKCGDASCGFCASRPEKPSMSADKRTWGETDVNE